MCFPHVKYLCTQIPVKDRKVEVQQREKAASYIEFGVYVGVALANYCRDAWLVINIKVPWNSSSTADLILYFMS